MSKKINIGLIGLGTVGQGLLELLAANKQLILDKTNAEFVVKKAVVRSLKKRRSALASNVELSKELSFVTTDPNINILVEVAGDQDIALSALQEALAANKGFVTANKALIAEQGAKVWPLFQKYNTLVGFEASVGGSLPIMRILKESFSADKIYLVATIINGTANYILTAMAKKNIDFDEALQMAIKGGYAEADPKMDIDGTDTAHKIGIIANLAFHHRFDFKQIYKEGIAKISFRDLHYAKKFGFVVKLLGLAKKSAAGYRVTVHPTMIKDTSILAPVDGVYNAALIRGNFLGDSLIYGRGAGAHPTAVSVAADLIEIVRNQSSFEKGSALFFHKIAYDLKYQTVIPPATLEYEHYLRLTVKDEVGVLSKLARIISAHNISISQIIQQESSENGKGLVDLVVITHEATNLSIKQVITEIKRHKLSKYTPIHIRIERDI